MPAHYGAPLFGTHPLATPPTIPPRTPSPEPSGIPLAAIKEEGGVLSSEKPVRTETKTDVNGEATVSGNDSEEEVKAKTESSNQEAAAAPILRNVVIPPSTLNPKFPAIVFSHGLGAMRTSYSTVCCDLASHGYIVASVEHRYSKVRTHD